MLIIRKVVVILHCILTMKTLMNHLVPLEQLDCRSDNNNWVLRRLLQHCDRDTSYILPLQADGHVILASNHSCD